MSSKITKLCDFRWIKKKFQVQDDLIHLKDIQKMMLAKSHM